MAIKRRFKEREFDFEEMVKEIIKDTFEDTNYNDVGMGDGVYNWDAKGTSQESRDKIFITFPCSLSYMLGSGYFPSNKSVEKELRKMIEYYQDVASEQVWEENQDLLEGLGLKKKDVDYNTLYENDLYDLTEELDNLFQTYCDDDDLYVLLGADIDSNYDEMSIEFYIDITDRYHRTIGKPNYKSFKRDFESTDAFDVIEEIIQDTVKELCGQF